MINPFFKNQGPFKIEDILTLLIQVIRIIIQDLKLLILKILLQQQIMILLFFIPKNMKVQLLLLKQLIV